MTISNNRNGKVFKTSKQGYSVSKIYKKIFDFIGVENIDDCNIAKTGSAYLYFDYNGVSYEIRISNHTKRSSVNDFAEISNKINVTEREVWVNPKQRELGTYMCKECEFEILNTETKNLFFEFLGIK